MPVSLKQSQVEEYLLENGCILISVYQDNKSKITIKCRCGHTRDSNLGRIKTWKQFNCKDCTLKNNYANFSISPENIHPKNNYANFSKSLEHIHPKTYQKIKKIFESKYEKTLKYRVDFLPENYNQMLHCWNCDTYKNRRNFPYRKQYALNKEKRCKNCIYKNCIERRNNHTQEQFISQMIKGCEYLSIKRVDRGRTKCGNFDIDTNFIIELGKKQNNLCIYSNRELGWRINAPNKCSIDRIDSSKGYTKDNVQLVCQLVNQAKSDMTHENFIQFIQETYHKKPIIDTDATKNIPDIKKINIMLKTSKSSAKKRENSGRKEASIHTLTKEEVIDICNKQVNKCVYTGHNLWNSTEKASIDRIDSNKGYIKSNIQLITFKANQAKSNLTEVKFFELIKDIYIHSCCK